MICSIRFDFSGIGRRIYPKGMHGVLRGRRRFMGWSVHGPSGYCTYLDGFLVGVACSVYTCEEALPITPKDKLTMFLFLISGFGFRLESTGYGMR